MSASIDSSRWNIHAISNLVYHGLQLALKIYLTSS